VETYLNFPVGFTFCSVYRVMKADCCFFERSHHTESSSLTLLKLSAGAVATSRKEHRSRKADQAPAALDLLAHPGEGQSRICVRQLYDPIQFFFGQHEQVFPLAGRVWGEVFRSAFKAKADLQRRPP
jgi:hypothetical protein